jgi:Response regulator containing a CheY-like receiver domain and an HTH DNA-binding domain
MRSGTPLGLTLSELEEEIVSQLCNGKTVKEIAYQMGLHVRTIDYHLLRMRRRFNCKTTVHLVATLQTGERSRREKVGL